MSTDTEPKSRVLCDLCGDITPGWAYGPNRDQKACYRCAGKPDYPADWTGRRPSGDFRQDLFDADALLLMVLQRLRPLAAILTAIVDDEEGDEWLTDHVDAVYEIQRLAESLRPTS